MQGNGFVKTITILLLIVTLLQCAYILPTRNVEAKARDYAESKVLGIANVEESERIKRESVSHYLDSISSEKVFSIPLIKSFTYDELKKQQLHLGLDLKGGQSVVLQVDMKDLLLELSGNSKDPTFVEALTKAEASQINSQLDFVSLFADEFQKIGADKSLANIFLRNASLREEINTQSSNGDVIRILRKKADAVVLLTYNRLKQRIDRLGVTQPNVQLDATRDLILIELPGIDNPERARKFLQGSANLEFWNVYRISEVVNAFQQADQILKLEQGAEANIEQTRFDTVYVPQYDSLGNVKDSVMQITNAGNDPLLNQGPLLKVLKLNASSDQGLLYPLAVMGAANKNQKDVIDNLLTREDVVALFPRDGKFLWSQKPIIDYQTREETDLYELYLIKKEQGSDKAPLQGDVVISASQAPDPVTGQIQVSLLMNAQGAREWAEMTTLAANDNNREIAIALDDEVVSAPRVNQAITGGSSSISGNFSVEEASDLASILEVGKLPAKVKIVQESTIGPSLGKENIRQSVITCVAGFLLVLLFMTFYYGTAGFVSILALVANLIFIFGALASLGTVLTLPGIAGILLTIGTAVDANVIIYERVREELRAGKSLLASIADGFKNSYSSLIDANVTALMVAFILSYFGLGPIKGFAVVLIVGIISTMFTGVLLSKLMVDWWTKSKSRSLSFWHPTTKNFLTNMKVDWIGNRKYAYAFSSILILAGIISMFTRGFDYGVDFRGGYSYVVQFDNNIRVTPNEIRDGLTTTFAGSSTTVKSVDINNTYNIVTSYLISSNDANAADSVQAKLFRGINAIQGGNLQFDRFVSSNTIGDTHIISTSKVGPTIADDIKSSSFKAGLFSLIVIFLYILVRFSKWQFSLGAVAALFHDTLVVLGVFSLLWGIMPFSLEIDQAFIAAILTVMAYSMNDTVIVFDRIRENFRIYQDKPTDEILNLSINTTFSRTTITSFTILLVVFMLLVFSGGSLKGFAFALFIGILIGTYSSIFVATPLARDLSKDLKSGFKAETTKKHFSKAVKS